jgi:hypothetical protein
MYSQVQRASGAQRSAKKRRKRDRSAPELPSDDLGSLSDSSAADDVAGPSGLSGLSAYDHERRQRDLEREKEAEKLEEDIRRANVRAALDFTAPLDSLSLPKSAGRNL